MLRPLSALPAQDPDSWLLALFGGGTAAGVWLPGALFVGTFITEDLSCVAAGIFAAEGRISFVVATVACILGIWLGDLGLYLIGRFTSRGLLRWGWARRRLEGISGGTWRQAFDRHGSRILFASRFVPGTRVPSYLFAGAVGWPFWRFASVLGIAVVIWTPLLVGASAVSGRIVLSWLERWGAYAWLAVPIAVLVAWLVIRTVPLVFTWRGRRLLFGRWLRLVRWEYWPAWLVFPPVVLDLCWQALRHRTPAVFTACNRGIPYGGLFGESKGDILDHFPPPDGTQDAVAVARYARLRLGEPLAERLERIRPFLATGSCVLKPDQGERGAGVAVIHGESEALAWLKACPFDALVQEYVSGAEYGISWSRNPVSGRGEIHSVAHKVLPEVIGDGHRDLEDLILADDRAVAMARLHLRRHAPRLAWVPAAGKHVPLGHLGTHSRGATFFDARQLITPELHGAFEKFLAGVDGIDFGRFDVRAPDAESLRAGRGIKVLEFNGVTGEAAHVYQPGYPWRRGIADMIAHLRRAAAIGAANRTAGHAPATAGELLRVLFTAWRRPRFEADEAVPVGTDAPGAEAMP